MRTDSSERAAIDDPRSPHPGVWHRIYTRLLEHCKRNGCATRPPPPYIFAGWHGSNDFQKLRRWEHLVEWAEHNKCTYIFAGIRDDDFYIVRELSNETYGWVAGGIHLPWTYDAKQCPSSEELCKYLECLRAQ